MNFLNYLLVLLPIIEEIVIRLSSDEVISIAIDPGALNEHPGAI